MTAKTLWQNAGDGSLATAGRVFEYKTAPGSAVTPTTNQYSDGGNAGIALDPGWWLVDMVSVISIGTMSALTVFQVGIGTTSGNNSPDVANDQQESASHTPGTFFTKRLIVPVYLATAKTLYPKGYLIATIGTATMINGIGAIRLA